MLTVVKKGVESALRGHPRLYAAFSKAYHKIHRSFRTLSPGAPDAIRRAFERSRQGLVGEDGDYYEFGVFRGFTFLSAQRSCDELGLAQVHFYGFDSFEGLPEVEGIDQTNNQFFEGQFACSKDEVVRNLTEHGIDWSRATLIEGFFSDSLTEEAKEQHPFRKAAVAFIDCDLYSSTVEVLDWLESILTDGSILLFDDWYSFGESPDLGQQKAFAEFVESHDEYVVEPFVEFEDHGKGFILRRR
jgi:hypothetical protein